MASIIAEDVESDAFQYEKGNISSTQTFDKIFMTISKAKTKAQKLPNCVGFCVESDKKPKEDKEYLCHFKEGAVNVVPDIGKWHTYVCPPKDDVGTVALKSGLNVPAGAGGGRRSSGHARTVTNFCKEANIEEADQLDLAEFIVAARYLGTEANDEQLMNVFVEMEETTASTKDAKSLIKDLMQKVQDDYGLGDGDNAADDDQNGDYEVVATNPLQAFAEDQQWQGDQIDLLFKSNEEEQNLKIAINLLKTTALTSTEVAEITGVDADTLAQYEEDDEDDDDEDEDDDEEATEVSKTVVDVVTPPDNETTAADSYKPDKKVGVTVTPAAGAAADAGSSGGGVTIRGDRFSKSVAMTKDDLGILKQIIDGGSDEVVKRSDDSLRLLTKFNAAINMNPKGHAKRTKTLAKMNSKMKLGLDDKKEDDGVIKLPAKYRVVIHPGALCKADKELASPEVCKLPIGTVVTVAEIDGRRARISAPSQGWLSLHASDGRVILQRTHIKSEMMDKAIHAERARQTKILILKSITTLNDATVSRILEKSDWNLRRAIEAFYIAKYKTQEYLTKKEQSGKGGKAASGGSKSPVPSAGGKKKGKMAWWKSWKTFANENQ